MVRRSNPTPPAPADEPHATRRVGGSRKEATERVRLRRADFEASGWTLNVSRGGARLVVEDRVEPGDQYDLLLGEAELFRPVRIVWVQDEADGQIVGVAFTDPVGSVGPPPSAPQNARLK